MDTPLPSPNLPPPQSEKAGTQPFPSYEVSPVPGHSPETASKAAELAPAPPVVAATPVTTQSPIVNPLAPPTATAPPASSSLQIPAPAMADDIDLIEREWVDKAKAIVEHTKDDPHLQNKEINKMKADYIQKRYNREIKVNEA